MSMSRTLIKAKWEFNLDRKTGHKQVLNINLITSSIRTIDRSRSARGFEASLINYIGIKFLKKPPNFFS